MKKFQTGGIWEMVSDRRTVREASTAHTTERLVRAVYEDANKVHDGQWWTFMRSYWNVRFYETDLLIMKEDEYRREDIENIQINR